MTPRRGQTAYDRRDNLVLACKPCNSAKADSAALTFLLADRRRASNILRYGDHLSPMLLALAQQLGGSVEPHDNGSFIAPDDDSPYADDSPYLDY